MASPNVSEEDLIIHLNNLDNETKEESSLLGVLVQDEDNQPEEDESWKGSLEEEDDEEEEFVEDAPPGTRLSFEKGKGDTTSGGESMELSKVSRSKKIMSYQDRVRILNLRRNLNQLDNLAKDKEVLFQKTREELTACHSRIDVLMSQQWNTEKEIEREEEAGNKAAVFRLQAMHRRLCAELRNEKDLESNIQKMLNENLLDSWKIEIEQGNFAALRKEVTQEEQELEAQREKQASIRLQKKKRRSLQLDIKWMMTDRKIQVANEEYETRLIRALGEFQKNRKRAVQFLKTSMARVRQKEKKEEEKRHEHNLERMETVLSLRDNIAANREKLRLVHALKSVKVLEAQQQEEKMKEAIKAEGHNVTREMHIYKQQMELERQKKEFVEQQKARRIEIVAQILKEEAQMEKVKKQTCPTRPEPKKPSDAERWRKKAWDYIEKTCDGSASPVDQKSRRISSPSSSLEARGRIWEDTFSSSKASQWIGTESEDEKEDGSETLDQPEFTGIWDQEYNISEVPDDSTDSKPLGATKLEKEIFAQHLEKLRRGFVHRHRVSGREYKGCPFYSKPSLIHFKNYDIGKTYKKKMILINAFYSINYCRLDGVSEHLKDFFTVDFDPPGPLSAGMSCEVWITFKPMINEDLEGEISFLSQIGAFSIPLKCTTKKCVLALDKELIDFGTHVVGETISRTITLTNNGALGMGFQLRPAGADVMQPPPELPSFDSRVGFEPSDPKLSDAKEGRDRGVSFPRLEKVIQLTTPNTVPNTEVADQVSGADMIEEKESLDTSTIEGQSKEELAEIKLGKITEGDIGPFSSVKLQVIFTPIIPGAAHAEFEVIFDNLDCKPLYFRAVGVSVTLPVWVLNPEMDLKICMYDRLYQHTVVIQSTATSALRLEFPVCKEMANHMELLPNTGYIQAHSSFSVQLKFLPRQTLPQDAPKYFDSETRVLQVPMKIIVSDQKKPVKYTIHAIITTSDVEINPTELNFGYCSIYEAVRTTITLTNKAILPQEFGFVKLPEFVEIQPNDGFGVLLPLESLTLDVLFHAKRAKEYDFELTCKTEINREFKLSCKATGVHPPLELSHSLVKFSATALNDVSTATIFVINHHTVLNEITHLVPKIGEGEPVPVGPTSFQFLVPEDAPLTFFPCVGTVMPGKKCTVRVSFHPELCDQLIRKEAVNILRQAAEAKQQAEKRAWELEQQRRQEEILMAKKDGKKRSSSNYLIQSTRMDRGSKFSFKPYDSPLPEDIRPDSEEYITAHLNLIRSFKEQFEKYVIPCLVASGKIDEKTGAENLQYSPYYTLYLEVHCPAVGPSVMVTSNNGKSVFNFGDIAIGHRIKINIEMQNISQEDLTIILVLRGASILVELNLDNLFFSLSGTAQLSYSLLNPYGPFLVVNPTKKVAEGASLTLIVSFCPDEANRYFEKLAIRTEKATLTLTLIGQGVIASIACSVEGDVLHMGYVVTNETATTTFKIENTSIIPQKFKMLLDSLLPYKERVRQHLPSFLSSQGKADIVGTQNYSGLSVFSIAPVECTILPGKYQEFTVTFTPDHESLYYSDRVQIVLFDKEVIRMIELKGAARNHIMYVEGGDQLDVPVESLAITTSMADEAAKAESDKIKKPILLSLVSVQSETFVHPAVRELKVGAIRSTLMASKKNIEFSWDNLPHLLQKGFTVDPVKGTVERGQTKTITVSWMPPAGSDPNQPVTTSATLTVKGNVKEYYSVYFMGRIVMTK